VVAVAQRLVTGVEDGPLVLGAGVLDGREVGDARRNHELDARGTAVESARAGEDDARDDVRDELARDRGDALRGTRPAAAPAPPAAPSIPLTAGTAGRALRELAGETIGKTLETFDNYTKPIANFATGLLGGTPTPPAPTSQRPLVAPVTPATVLPAAPLPPNLSGAGPVAQVAPASYQSQRLAEMGIPVDAQNAAPVTDTARSSRLRDGTGTSGGVLLSATSTPGVTNLGSYGGDSNIYATASKPGGRLDTFTGVGAQSQGTSSAPPDPLLEALRASSSSATQAPASAPRIPDAPRSRASEINANFDKQLSAVRSTYSGAGAGNGIRAAMDIERMRNAALAEDASTQASLRGQSINAGNAAAALAQSSQAANQTDAFRNRQLLTNIALQRQTAAAQGLPNALRDQLALEKAQSAAQRAQTDVEERGAKRYQENLNTMFNDPDKNVAQQKREAFDQFIAATDPKILQEQAGVSSMQELLSLKPAPQKAALQQLRVMAEMQDAYNTYSGSQTSTAFIPPEGDPRDASLDDIANRNLGFVDYVENKFGGSRVQQMSDGRVIPYDTYVGSSQDRERARKAALRNPQ
jgi:hypothetical protein